MNVRSNENCEACGGNGKRVDPEKLRAARVKKGLSGKEMAERLGFSAVYISDIERGKRACSPEIAKAYENL